MGSLFHAKFLIENSKSYFDFEYLNIFDGIMMKKKNNIKSQCHNTRPLW